MNYDVIVVGAGPAGLSSAYAAAKSGVRVVVLEKSREIGYPIHTSGGSWIDELKKLDIPDRFMNPIYEGFFISTNSRAEFKYTRPESCVLDVRNLYQYLAEIAAAAGAEILINTKVTGPFFKENKISGVKVRRLNQEIFFEAPVIIDASGMARVIARDLGLTNGFARFGKGAEYDLYAPHWPKRRAAFLFGNKFAPAGYAWLLPYKRNRLRIGVGIIYPDSTSDPKLYLDNIISNSHIFPDELSRISCIEYHTGTVPGEIYLKRTIADGLLVVGDAGGLISTFLGEGIRYAIDIGRMAGKIAAEAVFKKRYDVDFLKQFEKYWKKKYKHSFQLGAYINQRLARYTDKQWDKRIKALSTLEPRFIPVLLKGNYDTMNLLTIMKSNPEIIKSKAYSTLRTILKNA